MEYNGNAFLGRLLYIVTFCFNIFVLKNVKLRIKKEKEKKKPTLIFRYFGSVGKGQTNIFFFLGFNSEMLVCCLFNGQ